MKKACNSEDESIKQATIFMLEQFYSIY